MGSQFKMDKIMFFLCWKKQTMKRCDSVTALTFELLKGQNNLLKTEYKNYLGDKLKKKLRK